MRKLFLSMLVVFMVILTACGGGNASKTETGNTNDSGSTTEAPTADKKVTIKIAHVASEQNVYHQAVKHFADKATELSNGSIEFQIYPGGQLGGDRDMLESVQNGSLDAGYISLGIFEGITPVFTGFQLPYLIDDYETGYKAMTSETAQKALDSLSEHNMKGLAIVENGMRVVGNNVRPIRTPDDFKGLKLRSPEAGLQLEMFKALGASPTPMPYPEIYTSLQTGVMDGQDQYLMTWVTDKFHEVIKYLSVTKMYTWPAVITINLDKFNSLSDAQKKALEDAAKEAQKFIYDQLEDFDRQALEELKKNPNIQIDEGIDTAPFEEKVKPLYDQYAQKHPLIQETIELVQQIKASK